MQISFPSKEVRNFVKQLESQVLFLEDVRRKRSGHLKLSITTENRSGEIISLLIRVPSTPSCARWKRNKISEINKEFRKPDIPEITLREK